MKYARVQDTTFVRDLKTSAILQTDQVILRRHEMRIKELQKEQMREQEINNLKEDVQELRNLLKQLMECKH